MIFTFQTNFDTMIRVVNMKKTIMIDMDNVICEGGYLHLVNAFLNTHYSEEDLHGYFAESLVPEEMREAYEEYFHKHNVYDYAMEIRDAVSIIEKLSKQYQVYICTAYYGHIQPEKLGYLLLYKFNWLTEHFPFLDARNFIMTNNKQILDVDIKIDDTLENLEGHGSIKLLFDSYHNRNISKEELEKKNVIRVKNWLEIKDILL